MREAATYEELSFTFTDSAWSHQLEIAQLTEVISEDFFGRIQDLVFQRVSAVFDEMRREHEGPVFDAADPYPEQASRHAAVMYPNVLLSSLFSSSYFSFEHELTALCQQIERIGKHSIKLKDLNHKGVARARVYLEKVVGVKFPQDDQDGRFLQQINALRNLISHNGGYLDGPDDRSEAGNYVRAEQHLSLDAQNWIIFSPKFVISVAERLQELCLQLSNTLYWFEREWEADRLYDDDEDEV